VVACAALRNALGLGETAVDPSPQRPLRVAALFAGPAGTGKTMAAHLLAAALGRDVYRVDLSRVVSRDIGETEKNLDAIFRSAARSDAVLVFDEADALFGRRTGVRDAHDRYANLETSHLLERIERYDGAVIVTTNGGERIDPDVLDRLRVVVVFPHPPRP
jgi:SpoVK/Ycf46/Vps4 family AAA+-type ATPase